MYFPTNKNSSMMKNNNPTPITTSARGKSKTFEYNGSLIRKSIYFQQTRNKWVVQWGFPDGKRRTQTFNCNVLGREQALRLAEAVTPEDIPPEQPTPNWIRKRIHDSMFLNLQKMHSVPSDHSAPHFDHLNHHPFSAEHNNPASYALATHPSLASIPPHLHHAYYRYPHLIDKNALSNGTLPPTNDNSIVTKMIKPSMAHNAMLEKANDPSFTSNGDTYVNTSSEYSNGTNNGTNYVHNTPMAYGNTAFTNGESSYNNTPRYQERGGPYYQNTTLLKRITRPSPYSIATASTTDTNNDSANCTYPSNEVSNAPYLAHNTPTPSNPTYTGNNPASYLSNGTSVPPSYLSNRTTNPNQYLSNGTSTESNTTYPFYNTNEGRNHPHNNNTTNQGSNATLNSTNNNTNTNTNTVSNTPLYDTYTPRIIYDNNGQAYAQESSMGAAHYITNGTSSGQMYGMSGSGFPGGVSGEGFAPIGNCNQPLAGYQMRMKFLEQFAALQAYQKTGGQMSGRFLGIENSLSHLSTPSHLSSASPLSHLSAPSPIASHPHLSMAAAGETQRSLTEGKGQIQGKEGGERETRRGEERRGEKEGRTGGMNLFRSDTTQTGVSSISVEGMNVEGNFAGKNFSMEGNHGFISSMASHSNGTGQQRMDEYHLSHLSHLSRSSPLSYLSSSSSQGTHNALFGRSASLPHIMLNNTPSYEEAAVYGYKAYGEERRGEERRGEESKGEEGQENGNAKDVTGVKRALETEEGKGEERGGEERRGEERFVKKRNVLQEFLDRRLLKASISAVSASSTNNYCLGSIYDDEEDSHIPRKCLDGEKQMLSPFRERGMGEMGEGREEGRDRRDTSLTYSTSAQVHHSLDDDNSYSHDKNKNRYLNSFDRRFFSYSMSFTMD